MASVASEKKFNNVFCNDNSFLIVIIQYISTDVEKFNMFQKYGVISASDTAVVQALNII